MIIILPKQVKYTLCVHSIEKEHAHSVRTFCQINKKYFASSSFDNTIKIWEINCWKDIQTLYGHKFNIICLLALF